MSTMQKLFCFLILFPAGLFLHAQTDGVAVLKVTDPQAVPLSHATVELLAQKDSSLFKVQMTDTNGTAVFTNLLPGTYFWRVSRVGYTTHLSAPFSVSVNSAAKLPAVVLHPFNGRLSSITVSARRPFIELKPGKTIVNMEAGSSSAGATVLEALEKLPGITIDKDGNISLKGRSGVTILIDGRPTYLDASQLSTFLGGMSASQVSQVEIMDQPPRAVRCCQ